MALRVTCPKCGAVLTAPKSAVGKSSPCPKCKTIIKLAAGVDYPRAAIPVQPLPPEQPTFPPPAVLPTAEIVYPPPVVVPPQYVDVGEPAAVFRDCPFCGEEIKETAKKCRHCGEVLDPVLRAAEEAQRTAELAHRGRRGDVIVQQTAIMQQQQQQGRRTHPLVSCLAALIVVGLAIWGCSGLLSTFKGTGPAPAQNTQAKQDQPTPVVPVALDRQPDFAFAADDWMNLVRDAENAVFRNNDTALRNKLVGMLVDVSGKVGNINPVPGKDQVVIRMVGENTPQTKGVYFPLTRGQSRGLVKGQRIVVRGTVQLEATADPALPAIMLGMCELVPKS